ncbi:hypothetical protein [Streptomyces sp. NPDC088762]|uniref:hypothetical protein n=1 Tax=Streptomyces sp. NPDC088762 TaxID=3365891 RepID=UPI0037F830F2
MYADSEGRAALIGADFVEAITLIVVLPFWYGLAKGFAISKHGSDLRADHPDFDAECDRLLHALGPASISEEEAATRLWLWLHARPWTTRREYRTTITCRPKRRTPVRLPANRRGHQRQRSHQHP